MSYQANQVWTGSPVNPQKTQAYVYPADRLNRQSVTENGVAANYVTNALNQITQWTGQTIGYDGNFNFASIGGWLYGYDSENHLTSLGNPGPRAAFVYDGLGRCVKRTIDGVTTMITYDGWKPILEFDGAGNPQVWNVYGPGPDEILLRITNSALLRYHSDRQGNVAFILDANGYGSERYTYDAFGKPAITDWNGNVRTSSAIGNRFMFQGREYFREIGLYDYRHRFYDPYIGRFIQTDPMGLQTEEEKLSAGQKALFSPGGSAPEAFSSSEMNLFRYCGDDPVDGSDPTGLKPGDPFDSPEGAARDVHNFINPTSIKNNAEYGSVIYRVGDNFFASPTFTNGSQTRVTLGTEKDKSRIPKEVRSKATREGDYHSHGDYAKIIIDPKTSKESIVRATRAENPDSNNSSADDKVRAGIILEKVQGYRLFLGAPSGELKMYNSKKDKPL